MEFPFGVFDGERVRDESGALFGDDRWHSRGWDVKRNSVIVYIYTRTIRIRQSEYANRKMPIGICNGK